MMTEKKKRRGEDVSLSWIEADLAKLHDRVMAQGGREKPAPQDPQV